MQQSIKVFYDEKYFDSIIYVNNLILLLRYVTLKLIVEITKYSLYSLEYFRLYVFPKI